MPCSVIRRPSSHGGEMMRCRRCAARGQNPCASAAVIHLIVLLRFVTLSSPFPSSPRRSFCSRATSRPVPCITIGKPIPWPRCAAVCWKVRAAALSPRSKQLSMPRRAMRNYFVLWPLSRLILRPLRHAVPTISSIHSGSPRMSIAPVTRPCWLVCMISLVRRPSSRTFRKRRKASRRRSLPSSPSCVKLVISPPPTRSKNSSKPLQMRLCSPSICFAVPLMQLPRPATASRQASCAALPIS